MMDKIRKGSVKVSLKDRLFSFGYGIGASVVIIGVLFKLMYWEGADIMLTVGLVTEALIFAMSAFEKPLKTYEWDKLFDFESGQVDLRLNDGFKFKAPQVNGDSHEGQVDEATEKQATDAPPMYHHHQPSAVAPTVASPSAAPATPTSPFTASPVASPVSAIPVEGAVPYAAMPPIPSLNDEDAQKLSQSIQNLTDTANKLNVIASISVEAQKFTDSIQEISTNTSKYAATQEGLIKAAGNLHQAYERLSLDTEKIEMNTQEYRTKIERINNNLAGMNSIYEILLKDIHSQSVNFHNQTEISKRMSDEMQSVTREMGKLVGISDDFTVATNRIKTNASELADTVAKLNSIYGNMLNSLS